MKIRYQDDVATLYQGEALRVLHTLDDESVDALTSIATTAAHRLSQDALDLT